MPEHIPPLLGPEDGNLLAQRFALDQLFEFERCIIEGLAPCGLNATKSEKTYLTATGNHIQRTVYDYDTGELKRVASEVLTERSDDISAPDPVRDAALMSGLTTTSSDTRTMDTEAGVRVPLSKKIVDTALAKGISCGMTTTVLPMRRQA